MTPLRFVLALCAMAAVSAGAGCAPQPVPSQSVPDAALAQAVYRHNGPPALTLFTMVNNYNGSGAHTSLMVNGSQRVIFDPAGSFRHPEIATRNDVVYGVTPGMEDVYTRFHARKTFHVIVQHVEVAPEVAEDILRRVLQTQPVPRAQCALSTSELLSQTPGLNGAVRSTWFPKQLADQFGQIPGATTRRLYEYDDADRFKALENFDPARVKSMQPAEVTPTSQSGG